MATDSDNAGVKIFPPGVYLVAIGIGYAIRHFWPVGIFSESLVHPGYVAGLVVLVAGVLLAVSAIGLFVRSKTSVNPTKPATTLVIRGPYLFTRNPMYLSWVLLMVGLAMMEDSFWLLIMVIPAMYVIRRTAIDREERYLATKFGDEYRAYCARVRRWI
jgi:protein-S-isoprenylcysteine O-methyltransferase Ste14